jgi:hypothetical protein
MLSKAKISLFIVLFLLLGTLATSASADLPDPTKEATITKPELEVRIKVPQEAIQNVGTSTLQIVTPTELPIGSAFDLCFGFFVQSPDAEYGDYVTVDMPDNWVVNSFAPNSVPPANGCSAALPPVAGVGAGNIAYWQSTGYPPPTGCGAWNGSSGGILFNFCVNVTIPDESGAPWMLPWNYVGDGWGGEPHFAVGSYGPVGPVSPLILTPEIYHTQGCRFEPQTHEFTAMNSTEVEMMVDLDYTITSGMGTCDGPESIMVPAHGNAPVLVTFEAWSDVGTSFTCDITATDSAVPANTDTSQLIKDLVACYWDPAGWQLEPIADATPNQWSAGLVGTNPGAAGPVGYVIGGLAVGSSVINPDLQMYDPTAGVWTQLTDLPNPRFSPVAGWIGGSIFAAGGYNTVFVSTGDLQVYNPETNVWDNTTLPDMPNARGGGAGGVGTCSSGVGECLFHVGGGLDSNFANTTLETWEFDPSSSAWTQLDNKPAGSSPDGLIFGAGVGCGGKIYVGGDYRGFHDFFVLDPTAPAGSQWSVLTSIPATAGAMTPALVCNEVEQTIYLVGGSAYGSWADFTDTVFVYDILTNTWEGPLFHTMNVAQLGSVGWFMQNKLWSVGGTMGSGAISPMPFESLERITCVIEKKLFLPLMLK